ncbi:hypothetical protein BJ138DRAFT_1165851 [Hygrophoropsis aurantiaca]|uniref:Uncharacterized protein n=1 Tax=Hygrophoropsis aurantiaca TaxID=72124 RepID=A0ACB7ZVE5_9AGAM|nr:hypothetical protein BJ138DRAFT_1165851 [Hygrophoropsis aurantiaca]
MLATNLAVFLVCLLVLPLAFSLQAIKDQLDFVPSVFDGTSRVGLIDSEPLPQWPPSSNSSTYGGQRVEIFRAATSCELEEPHLRASARTPL